MFRLASIVFNSLNTLQFFLICGTDHVVALDSEHSGFQWRVAVVEWFDLMAYREKQIYFGSFKTDWADKNRW